MCNQEFKKEIPTAMSPESHTRRDALLKLLRLGGLGTATAGVGVWLQSRSHRPEEPAALSFQSNFTVPPDANLPEMVIAHGEDPRALVGRAVEALGGIRRFIARGDVVVIKPNVAWDRTPAQAANTNPDVVAEVARLCLEAGAKKVVVTDVSCNEPRRCFERSGIARASTAAGAEIILPEDRRFKEVNLRGDVLGEWPVLDPFLQADKVINIPVAKHHDLTGVTLGMKNWYGILGGMRQQLHQHIHESLADLADFMRPTLTLIDAYRVLVRNGPTGGSLDDVLVKKTLFAGTDPVALDACVAQVYWNLDARTLRYLTLAQARGLGKVDFGNVRTRTIQT